MDKIVELAQIFGIIFGFLTTIVLIIWGFWALGAYVEELDNPLYMVIYSLFTASCFLTIIVGFAAHA